MHTTPCTAAPVVLPLVVTINVIAMVTVIATIAVIFSCFLLKKNKTAASKSSSVHLLMIIVHIFL